jgi:hypothetical protein
MLNVFLLNGILLNVFLPNAAAPMEHPDWIYTIQLIFCQMMKVEIINELINVDTAAVNGSDYCTHS